MSDIAAQIEGATAQQNALLEEQKQFALVGAEYPLASAEAPLRAELAGNEAFEKKLEWLAQQAEGKVPVGRSIVASYRPVRRDGSCFYRSALFHIFNRIALEGNGCLPDGTAGPASMASSLKLLLILGEWKSSLKRYFGEFVEDFVEATEEMVKKVMAVRVPVCEGRAWRRQIGDEVAALLADPETNAFEFIVCLARYAVSMFLRDRTSLFAPFVAHIVDLGDDDLSVQTYCEREVDVVGGECDEVHLLTFSAAFKVDLDVVVIDNNAGGADNACSVREISFADTLTGLCGEEASGGLSDLGPYTGIAFPLLFRPGHYEILLA